MGAYRYCSCGAPLNKPTLFEVMYDLYACRACKKPIEYDKFEALASIVQDMDERLEFLEKQKEQL